MNIALGIGALLLGGWVLNTPVEEQEDLAASQSAAPSSAIMPSRGPNAANPERMLPRDQAQMNLRQQSRYQGRQPAGQKTTGQQGSASSGAQAGLLGTGLTSPMPAAPTDSLAGATGMMPLSPTASQDEINANAEAARAAALTQPSAGNPYGAFMPEMPTSRRVNSPRTAYAPSMYESVTGQRRQTQQSIHPSSISQPAPEKAFASYRPYSSGVSPYMNLFRNDTAGGTIDNYTTFVRPALDQRSMNQQFNMDLYGLERNSRLQQSAMRQMSQGAARQLQGVGTPQYERSFGNYYPSYGSSSPSSYSGAGSYWRQNPYGEY